MHKSPYYTRGGMKVDFGDGYVYESGMTMRAEYSVEVFQLEKGK